MFPPAREQGNRHITRRSGLSGPVGTFIRFTVPTVVLVFQGGGNTGSTGNTGGGVARLQPNWRGRGRADSPPSVCCVTDPRLSSRLPSPRFSPPLASPRVLLFFRRLISRQDRALQRRLSGTHNAQWCRSSVSPRSRRLEYSPVHASRSSRRTGGRHRLPAPRRGGISRTRPRILRWRSGR
jgi:hypothetical protein